MILQSLLAHYFQGLHDVVNSLQNSLNIAYTFKFIFPVIMLLLIISFIKLSQHKLRKKNRAETLSPPPHFITSNDIKMVAGEDVIATQLDLARAYIELNKKALAKKILDHVSQHGDASQKQQALQLTSYL